MMLTNPSIQPRAAADCARVPKQLLNFDVSQIANSYLVVGCDGVSESNPVKIVAASSAEEAASKFKQWVLAATEDATRVDVIDVSTLHFELNSRIV